MQTALQAMVFGWPAFVLPFAFALNPALILSGTIGNIALALLTAATGTALTCLGIIGLARGRIAPALRLVCIAGGLSLLLWPALLA